MGAIAAGTAPTGTVIEAVPESGGDGFPFGGLLGAAKAGETGPQAYLNILVFDENLDTLDMAYAPVTDAAKENGSNTAHEKLALEIVVQQPGYVYIYLSNDNEQPLEVFFDDFTVEHSHSAIVQADDYYPFGLTFNSYRRESSKKNRFLYNEGSELQDDLGLGVFQTQFRMLDPAIGRWWQVDPKADFESLVSWTPYNYSFNNPIRWNDPLGDCPPGVDCNSQSLFLGELKKAYDAAVQMVENTAKAVEKIASNMSVAVSKAVDYALGDLSGEGGSQTAGIPLVTSEGSVSPVRQTAEHTEAEVNIDLLQPAIGGANAGKFNRGSFDFAEGMGKVSEGVKVVKEMSEGLDERRSTTSTSQSNSSNKADTIREVYKKGNSFQIKQYVTNEKGDTTHETLIGSNIFFPRKK